MYVCNIRITSGFHPYPHSLSEVEGQPSQCIFCGQIDCQWLIQLEKNLEPSAKKLQLSSNAECPSPTNLQEDIKTDAPPFTLLVDGSVMTKEELPHFQPVCIWTGSQGIKGKAVKEGATRPWKSW